VPDTGHLIKLPSNGTRLAILVLAINFLLFCANLYLSNGYVSKTVYEADNRDTMQRRETLNAELRNIAIELRGIKDHMLGDEKQDQRMDKLEERIRDQERKK
jgi:hypothetical protein